MTTSKERRDNERLRAAKALRQLSEELTFPQRPELVREKINKAGAILGQLRVLALGERDVPNPAIATTVEPELTEKLSAVGHAVGDVVSPYGYMLLVFEFGEGGMMNYVSNALRDDMVIAMREFIQMHEAGADQPADES